MKKHNTTDFTSVAEDLAHQISVDMEKAEADNKRKREKKAAEAEATKKAKESAENRLGALPSGRGVTAPSNLGGCTFDLTGSDEKALSFLSGATKSPGSGSKCYMKCMISTDVSNSNLSLHM